MLVIETSLHYDARSENHKKNAQCSSLDIYIVL